jgi:hypothetical protein
MVARRPGASTIARGGGYRHAARVAGCIGARGDACADLCTCRHRRQAAPDPPGSRAGGQRRVPHDDAKSNRAQYDGLSVREPSGGGLYVGRQPSLRQGRHRTHQCRRHAMVSRSSGRFVYPRVCDRACNDLRVALPRDDSRYCPAEIPGGFPRLRRAVLEVAAIASHGRMSAWPAAQKRAARIVKLPDAGGGQARAVGRAAWAPPPRRVRPVPGLIGTPDNVSGLWRQVRLISSSAGRASCAISFTRGRWLLS